MTSKAIIVFQLGSAGGGCGYASLKKNLNISLRDGLSFPFIYIIESQGVTILNRSNPVNHVNSETE